MTALDLLRDPVWQRIALVLLHFLWQGALIALLLGASLSLRCLRRPQVRYAAWLAGLMLMAACPCITFLLIDAPAHSAFTQRGDSYVASPHSPPVATGGDTIQPQTPINPLSPAPQDRLAAWIAPTAPYVVACWLAGIALFAGRLLLGFAGVHWLAARRCDAGANVCEQAELLASRMGLRRLPRIAVCARAGEAMAIGFVRPLILLPAAWITELPPEVLRAVLAHELAHIRRWDVWVNLLQRIVETLLFYHPAVWWVSHRVRAERELCCDDLAVRATGERIEYAQALECVAQRRFTASRPLSATGIGGRKMAILRRVRHVLGAEPEGAPRAGRWTAGLIALAVPAALWLAVSTWAPPLVGQEERERDVRERDQSAQHRDRVRRDRDQPREEAREDLERELSRAQQQAREAQDRAAEANRRFEEMIRRTSEGRERAYQQLREGEAREGRAGARGLLRREELARLLDRAEPPRDTGHPGPELIEEIRRLREEVERLRREVDELSRGPRPGYYMERRRMDGDDVLVPRFRFKRERDEDAERDAHDRREFRSEWRDLPPGVQPPFRPGLPAWDRPRRDREEDSEDDRDRERHGDAEWRELGDPLRPPLPPFRPGPPDRPRPRTERDERRDQDEGGDEVGRSQREGEASETERRNRDRNDRLGDAAEAREHERSETSDSESSEQGRNSREPAQARLDMEGSVLSVADRTGKVEISLGATDGLRSGRHLDIYRDENGATTLGRIEIIHVAPDRAVGRVISEKMDETMREGDSVTTRTIESDSNAADRDD